MANEIKTLGNVTLQLDSSKIKINNKEVKKKELAYKYASKSSYIRTER